jgi:hypothetical protein
MEQIDAFGMGQVLRVKIQKLCRCGATRTSYSIFNAGLPLDVRYPVLSNRSMRAGAFGWAGMKSSGGKSGAIWYAEG